MKAFPDAAPPPVFRPVPRTRGSSGRDFAWIDFGKNFVLGRNGEYPRLRCPTGSCRRPIRGFGVADFEVADREKATWARAWGKFLIFFRWRGNRLQGSAFGGYPGAKFAGLAVTIGFAEQRRKQAPANQLGACGAGPNQRIEGR